MFYYFLIADLVRHWKQVYQDAAVVVVAVVAVVAVAVVGVAVGLNHLTTSESQTPSAKIETTSQLKKQRTSRFFLVQVF